MGPSQEGRHEDDDLKEHQIMKMYYDKSELSPIQLIGIGDSHEMR